MGVEQRSTEMREQFFETIVEYKAHWEAEFREYDRRGQPRPDIVPHPDDLALNARTGKIFFNGPFDDGEKAIWDRILAIKAEATQEKARLKKIAKRPGANRKLIEERIQFEQDCIDRFDALIPDEQTRRQPDFEIWKWREQQKKLLELKKKWRTSRDELNVAEK